MMDFSKKKPNRDELDTQVQNLKLELSNLKVTMETKIQQMESLTATVPGVLYQFVVLPDGEWKFLYVSKGVKSLYEVNADDVLRNHRTITDLIVCEDKESHRQSVEDAVRGLGFWEHEHRIRTLNGKLKWVRGQAMPQRLEDGSVLWNGILLDITEKKQKEAEIVRLSLERQTILDNLANGVFFLINREVVWANKKIVNLYGYNMEEVIGQNTLKFYPDEDEYEQFGKEAYQTLIKGLRYTCEARQKRKNGEIFWCSFLGQAINPNDPDKGSIWIIDDVTERKQMGEDLKESMEQYRLLSENTADGISLFEDNKVKYVSDGYLKMLGHEKQEIENITFEHIFSFLHPDDIKKILDQINLAHSQKRNSFKYDYRARHKDGHYIWVEDMINAEYDDLGNHLRSVIHSRDISERKQMEQIKEARLRLLTVASEKSLDELLQATLDELELLTESSIGFYHFLNADQETLLLQAWSTRTIKEMCKAEGKGQHYNVSEAGVWVDCIREHRAVIYNDYATLAHRKGLPAGHAEIIRILVVPIFRVGSIVAILGVGNKPIDYAEQDVAIVSELADLGWDIKERKIAEQKLQKTMQQLETLNNTKDKFFSIIAHDLRNPFSNIMGLSELMEKKMIVDNNGEAELLQYTKLIRTSSKHAYNLLENLLQWARSQTGDISLNHQIISIKDPISDTISLVSGNAYNKNISIETDLVKDDLVYADIFMVSTILRNLLTNAIKFTNKNGKIIVSAKKKKGFLEISISDTGVGIAPMNLEKVFKIDFKLSSLGTNKEKGTGLGLILCKEFVEKQGGMIWVESELGKGSVFTFTLPLQSKAML